MLNTPKGIQNSGGFTIAALFPNKDLNVHVNPTVRPPSALPPPPLTIRNEPSGPTSLDSANTSAQATSAMVLPPRTGQTTAGFTPGFGRSPSGPVSAIPGSGLDITQPPRRVDTGMRADNTLLPDSNMGKEVDLGLDMDIDMDVDMSLEMDTDLETKQSLATSMPISEPVQPPVKPAQPPVKPADSDDLSDSVRIAPSTHATADQMATSRISEPNLTASDQPISRPEISVEITTPAPPLQQESPLIQHSSSETHTRTPSPEAAPVSVPALQQQNSVQVLEPRLPLLPNSTEEIALVIDGPSSLNSAAVEALDRVITMSPPSKTAEEVPTSPVKRISPSNTLEEPIPVSRIEASLPVPSSTSMAEKAPDSEVQSMPADKAHPSPARVSAASRILDDPVMLLPVVTASPADLSLPAQAPPWVPSLESVPEKAPDSGVGSMQPSTPKPTGGHLESDEMMIPQEALPSIFDHAMQEDTIVLDKPSRVRASGREQTIPSASVDIDMDQADDTELPATRPSGLPPPSNVVELLSPPWPITILPDPPSSPGLAALPTPLALSAPPPPSQSPPPLPDSSLPQDIPAPVSAVTPSIPRSRLPSPSDSLPNTPAVLPGGGRLKVEVVIDQVEFENSKDGYFRRFTNGLDPEDVHPNDLLATFGFTKSFGHHLLNKRCVITTSFAKDELKQLVLEAGGKIVQLNYGVEFDVILVSNDFYPTLAEAQGDVTLSQADIWSFGAADYLNPKDWKLKRHIPKRSGLVSFTASSIIKNPELFLECLRKFHLLSRWNAFLTAETIRSIHNYLKHENTPQTLRLRMFKTMNEATGLFKVRYPRNTDDEDPVLREQRQMVARRIDKLNRWVDVQQEVCKNENLIQMGTLCAQIPEDKMPTNHRKYWERETEILNELADHQSKMDEIYAVKRSIFVGFDTSAIRKGLGNDAISELGFQDVEGYKMDDLFRDLSSDGKFAALLRPSEGIHSEEFE
ncbi:hypothetical protein QFC19_009524 [Naganishia cerealis]|uniref:Uncharacterized protein n=1 Tax=Naganishia cerealis TaxID=610337 RepID=A0ACC2UWB4_9TREE|nr:hypothetical protein QFC19_009524 [Naganishia cerealis]